MLDYALT